MAENFTTQAWEPSGIGVEVEAEEFAVEIDRTVAYAEAIEDTNEDHRSGRLAPPVFAVVPVMHAMARAMRMVVPSGFAVHGEHELLVHTPIRPGMHLRSTAAVTGLWPRPAGLVIVIRTETKTADGVPVNDQYWINLIPRASIPEGVGDEPPQHRMPEEMAARKPANVVRHALSPELGWRYAQASGDHSAYTFDLEDALSRGLPGIIVGGICIMSFASRALVDRLGSGNSARLKRLALRFSRFLVLRPGQSLETQMWDTAATSSQLQVRFGMADAEGTKVVTNGFAELQA